MPTGRYTEVLEKLRPGTLTPGDIVHVDGRRLGRHDGVVGFTVGQRRGLGIAARSRFTSCGSMRVATRWW